MSERLPWECVRVVVKLKVQHKLRSVEVDRPTYAAHCSYGLNNEENEKLFIPTPACCKMQDAPRLLNSCVSVLLYGLGRAAHGSWGQIGVQTDALRVLYIKGVFCSHLTWVVFTPLSSGAFGPD